MNIRVANANGEGDVNNVVELAKHFKAVYYMRNRWATRALNAVDLPSRSVIFSFCRSPMDDNDKAIMYTSYNFIVDFASAG